MGKCIRISTNSKITTEMNSPLEDITHDDDNTSHPNTQHILPKDVVSVKALEIYKVSTRAKRRWGYIHIPSNGPTSNNQKKMRRWGFVAPVVGIPSDFPVLCSITPPIRHISPKLYYHYI
ncbi:17043_t:CDS:1 [Funneliformis caledonium]|uniref:17043_t:CDS:1 n=1 Tax=Funneliformis caledonium TaxID=1117310 RepID=A0A9N9D5P2_9GLOM|nr:17043_t:CDS:1 [Funneliformis caledonium]